MRKCIFLLIISLVLIVASRESDAKTFAYLIGTDGTVLKLDTDIDTIVSTSKLEKAAYVQSGETSVVADNVNNHFIVVTGRLTPYIYVYDLKTLKFVKDFGLISGNPDVGILVSPNGKQLFIRWFDNKEGGWFFDLYDAKNLTEIRNLGEFVWEPITIFSPDGSKIYVYGNKKLRIYETTNFSLLDTIDLDTIWRTDVFTQGVEDLKNEKILISETDKVTLKDQPKDTLFVYNLKTKLLSPRISTSISGDEKLSPDGTKIFLKETQNVWSEDMSYIMYQKSMGKLHIYDVSTGKKWGAVQFTVDRDSEILGIHPNGNKIYMIGDIQGAKSLIVLDVVNLKVARTLKIPRYTVFIVFYNE